MTDGLEKRVQRTLADMKDELQVYPAVPNQVVAKARRGVHTTLLLLIGSLCVAAVGISFGVRAITSSMSPAGHVPLAPAAVSPTATDFPTTCTSPDDPDVISCEQAVDVAWHEHGSPGIPVSVDAHLESIEQQDTIASVKVWVVTFRGVTLLLEGPAGGCRLGDLAVYVGAIDASMLGTVGTPTDASPCPPSPSM